MKDIVSKILESEKDTFGNDVLIDDEVTLDVLKNAAYGSSFMDDRATLYVNDYGCYNKIGKDKWEWSSNKDHVIGSITNSENLWNKIKDTKHKKMYTK